MIKKVFFNLFYNYRILINVIHVWKCLGWDVMLVMWDNWPGLDLMLVGNLIGIEGDDLILGPYILMLVGSHELILDRLDDLRRNFRLWDDLRRNPG